MADASTPEIETFADTQTWAEAAATRLADTLRAALDESGQAVLAGAGGSTPSPIYRALSQIDLDWSRIVVTLVDERHVPEDSPESNARLIRETLLQDRAAQARLIPLHHPAVTVDRAAAQAAQALREIGGRVDAVLLGMGEDGHICSMFPHSPTLRTLLTPGAAPTVLGVPSGRDGLAPPQERISLNLSYLTGARRVVLALSGQAKRDVFEQEAQGDPALQPIAALIASHAPLDVLWTEARR